MFIAFSRDVTEQQAKSLDEKFSDSAAGSTASGNAAIHERAEQIIGITNLLA